jgi:hypothetical protein
VYEKDCPSNEIEKKFQDFLVKGEVKKSIKRKMKYKGENCSIVTVIVPNNSEFAE